MLIIGAKGFAKEVLEVLHQMNQIENVAFYDDINDDLGIYGLRIIIKSIASTSDNWHQINDNPDEPSIKAYYD